MQRRGRRPPARALGSLVALAALGAVAAGCVVRTVRADAEALEAFRVEGVAAAEAKTMKPFPVKLLGLAVTGEDRLAPVDRKWIVWIPFVPYGRAREAVVRGHELKPELERALWPWFGGATGDGASDSGATAPATITAAASPRPVVIRCALAESRIDEVVTLYGLSAVGGFIAALVGAPLKYLEGTAAARFEVLEAGVPPGTPPLFARDVRVAFKARAGMAGFLLWYNTDVKPRDVVFEAWAAALREFIAALPPPDSPLWRVTRGAVARPGPR